MGDLFLDSKNGLKKGKLILRVNRFLLDVEINSKTKKVYLRNSGELSTVLSPGRIVLLEKIDGKERKTDYNAFAIKIGDSYATVDSILPNKMFPKILDEGYLSDLKKYDKIYKEPNLPEHGRADFLLKREGKKAYIEIKSCTHVENGIAKFPDRPTKRGQRHLKSLIKLSNSGHESYILFFVQRTDAEKFQPYKEVDSKFSTLLKKAKKSGVHIKVHTIGFNPPNIFLKERNLIVELV